MEPCPTTIWTMLGPILAGIGILLSFASLRYASRTFRKQFEPQINREFYWRELKPNIYEARLIITNNTDVQWDLTKVKFKCSPKGAKIFAPEDCYGRDDYNQFTEFEKELMDGAKSVGQFKMHRTINAISQRGTQGHPFDPVQGNKTTVYFIVDLNEAPNRSLMLSSALSLSSSESIKRAKTFTHQKVIKVHINKEPQTT